MSKGLRALTGPSAPKDLLGLLALLVPMARLGLKVRLDLLVDRPALPVKLGPKGLPDLLALRGLTDHKAPRARPGRPGRPEQAHGQMMLAL